MNTFGKLADNNPDLLVHYAFENNLNEIAGSGTTGSPYNLTNINFQEGIFGGIKYAQSCGYGKSVYFDDKTGYLQNTDFNFGNIQTLNSRNFTVSMWVKPDGVLSSSQSALSTQNI